MILFVFTIAKGSIQYTKFNYISRDIKFYINIFSLYVIYLSYNFIAYDLYYFVLKIFNSQETDYGFWGFGLKLFLFAIMFSVYSVIFRFIYRMFFRRMIADIHELLTKLPSMIKSMIFGVIKIPKAVINVLVFVLILNTFSVFLNKESTLIKTINSSSIYSSLSNNLILPFRSSLNDIIFNIFDPIFDAFKDISISNVRYLYNGVTIDEATMRNKEIEEFAFSSVHGINNSYNRAKKFYEDVIDIMDYDNEKSEDILNNDFSNLSGAISAFETKKGICFDYASLYSVLAEIVGLPTRIVVGKGFDGNSWINHAWNEVYIDEIGKWIQLDTTFGETGNYFDVENFGQDHKKERIIWEFSV